MNPTLDDYVAEIESREQDRDMHYDLIEASEEEIAQLSETYNI